MSDMDEKSIILGCYLNLLCNKRKTFGADLQTYEIKILKAFRFFEAPGNKITVRKKLERLGLSNTVFWNTFAMDVLCVCVCQELAHNSLQKSHTTQCYPGL